MRSAAFAEWIISRCTEKSRAVSIVGDLVESAPEKGTLWFWLAVAGIVVSLIWRWCLALLAASFTLLLLWGPVEIAVYGISGPHRPPDSWTAVFSVLAVSATFLCMLVPYAGICFGLGDKFTQLTLILTGLTLTVTFFWWIRLALILSVVLFVFVALLSIFSDMRRRAALVLLTVVAVGFGTAFPVFYLANVLEIFLVPAHLADGINYALVLQPHPSICWVIFDEVLMLLVPLIITSVCSWTHRHLLEGDRLCYSIDR